MATSHEALGHENTGQIHYPCLVWSVDVQSFKQVGVDLVTLPGPATVGFLIKGGNPHLPHQALNPFAIHREAFILQPVTNPTAAV